MKKLKFVLPMIQVFLTVAAVVIDQSINKGHGEGSNQAIANLVSNVEFIFKQLLGYNDIINYNFTYITVLLAVCFWFLVGAILDRLLVSLRKK